MNNYILTVNDIIADMHTHSTFSLHAYSSIKENIEEAKKIGLKYIAITDHFYNDGTILDKKNETNRIAYLEERINPVENDIRVIGSSEFNLGQDIPYWDKIKHIVWRPIGLHNWFFDTENSTLDELYMSFKSSTERHNAFVHIERELHKMDHKKYGDSISPEIKHFLESICLLAKENNIYLEVNESSLITNECGTADRLFYWLNFAKKNENKIYLGTDAHYCMEVGKFKNALNLLNEVEYPKELILNCNEDMILNLKGL